MQAVRAIQAEGYAEDDQTWSFEGKRVAASTRMDLLGASDVTSLVRRPPWLLSRMKHYERHVCNILEPLTLLIRALDPCSNSANCNPVAEGSECLPPTDRGQGSRAADIAAYH